MRYLLMFVAGVGVGGASVFFSLRGIAAEHAAEQAVSAPAPPIVPPPTTASAPQQPAATEEEILAARVGMPIVRADSPPEQVISSEAPQEPAPELTLPPAALAPGSIVIPVVGVKRSDLKPMFNERRGNREHRAIDILAPRGTPVVAAIDGTVGKLFLSKPGGLTVYQYDPTKAWIYYYAHLDAYAPDLVEGKQLRRGDVIGYVGTSGNARPDSPHLHFAIEKLNEPGRWWKSVPIDPYPLLSTHGVTIERP